MTSEDKVRQLIAWLRDDDADATVDMLNGWASATESLLDGSARLQAHRANAAVIIASRMQTNANEKETAARVESLAHALLAAERPVSK